MSTHFATSGEQAPEAIIPVRPATGPATAPAPSTPAGLLRRTLGRLLPSRRTLGSRFNSRRTLGRLFPSRRTLGTRFNSRRTLGNRLPSRRTLGGRTYPSRRTLG
jgi:hypothetical protein